MSDEERIRRIPAGGPRIGAFEMWARPNPPGVLGTIGKSLPFLGDVNAGNYDERVLASYLALLCHGQIAPDIFGAHSQKKI